MPKEATRKLGDPRFDNKQEALDLPLAFTEEDEDLNLQYEVLKKFEKLFELMEFFEIDKNDKNAWLQLSMRLAEHYVPAMQFKKRTKPKKWNFLTLSALHCLVERMKTKYPDWSRTTIFYNLTAEIQNTSLEKIIGVNTQASTLEGHYDRFSSTTECMFLRSLFGDDLKQKEHVCEWFLTPKKMQPFETLQNYPDAVKKRYFEMVKYAVKNNCI